MSYFASPEFIRVALLGGLITLLMKWLKLVNKVVPQPYLDEVFHIPQAQAYWQGKWSQWDPKITTPPGLYLFSHVINTIRNWFNLEFEQNTNELRFVNVILLHLLLVALYFLTTVERRTVNHGSVLQRELCIVEFPLFFFFSSLYYTDIFSTFTVVLTYIAWSASSQATGSSKALFQMLHCLSGLAALATRQTNIFWVAIFLGGLQVVKSVKDRVGEKRIHDPPIFEAFFEDFPTTCISIAETALPMISQLLIDLWPQLLLLASFGGFISWNGGVVLGDKDNHVATIHLPQMLYLWPTFIFFSWPVLLPQFSNLQTFRQHLPRPATFFIWLIIMLAIVHVNTIIHPFTLADNRHYTFYIFKILRSHWLIKYAVTPIYLVCAWLVIVPLFGSGIRDNQNEDIVRVSFVLVWMISTSLSLITAPLVEPRYFIIPWLIWRMNIPEIVPSSAMTDTKPAEKKDSANTRILKVLASYSTWIELIWYMTINFVTCYVFLYKGFSWPQEPGKTQRFMW